MTWLRKLLRIGKLPADLRQQVDAEGILHLAEYVSVVARFTGRVPGRRSVGLVRGYGGSLVLTSQRVLGTLSAVPGKGGRAVDHRWSDHAGGAVTGTLSGEGLLLDIPDLSRVDPEFSGTFSLTYKSTLPADTLLRLPTTTIAFDVPPKFVYSALGIPRG
jgi:hypothetical protein